MMISKKYDLIVIDPPWRLNKIKRKVRENQTEMDYPMMSIEDIKSLPIESISSENSVCFLWTVQKYLFQAKEILENYGFTYRLTMVWEKTYGKSAGMPLFGFCYNAEFILVGYKGKQEMYPKRKLIPAVFQAENIRHSQKPDKFYEMVEPFGENRIDIFARKKRHGWNALGLDIDGKDIKESIELLARDTGGADD
jgi:N6-adenosine-specific RNA methylase IME4